MECDAEDLNNITMLHVWVLYLIRGYVDAFSFVNGYGITLILNSFRGADKVLKQLAPQHKELATLCNFTAQELFALNHAERGTLKHIHDLVESVIYPLEALILCARAVEGFRQLMLPSEPVPKQWDFMREHLNLTAPYLTYVTSLSTGPRHGSLDPVHVNDIIEVRTRGWTVATRFLEYRRRGNAKLPLEDFPII